MSIIAEERFRCRAADAFDGLFTTLDGRLSIRPEGPRDEVFLDDLATAASPLCGILPDAMIDQQATLQRLGHAEAYPAAMRRIAQHGGLQVGHIAIDWHPLGSRCIDISIMPWARGLGIGTALLEAWLIVANRLSLSAALSVRPDSKAVMLYRRLGFVECSAPHEALMTMSRGT